MTRFQRPYKTSIADGSTGCKACGAGAMFTVTQHTPDGDVEVLGESFRDEDLANSICEWMNDAFEAGVAASSGQS